MHYLSHQITGVGSMKQINQQKIIIVEGLADKLHIQKLISEPVDIICTHGTFGIGKFDNMLEKHDLDDREVYIFVDEDNAGHKLRKQLRAELPHAIDMFIDAEYVEVEAAPLKHIKSELEKNHFEIKRNILL